MWSPRPQGYLLVVRPGELDRAEFDELADRGQAAVASGDFATAAESFASALGLWRGRPFEDVEPGPWLRFERTQLGEQHLIVVEQYARARMESVWPAGRGAGGVHRDAPPVGDELGVEPGAGLRAMQQRVLAADPTLERAGVSTADIVVSAHRQLPADLANFTGRQADLARLYRHLDQAGDRSVTIVVVAGMAGVGKTRLAVHAAHELVQFGRYDEIQLWVDLRGFDQDSTPADPAGVLEGFLGLLGVPPRQIPAELAQRAALYRDRLAGKRALVLLDNAASEAQIRPLLPGGPGSLVLVTSRRTMPDLDGACSVQLDVLSATEAVALLARIVGEQRVADERGDATRVVELCGWLPIAVTIAAQRLRSRPRRTVKDLVGRLEIETRRLDELHGRNRAIRAAFDVSYRTLPAGRRRIFRLLGLHPADDYTADSVAALTGVAPHEAENTLNELLDEHLLHEVLPYRYRLHDLLRLYARERAVVEVGEQARETALRRVCTWYLHAAETAANRLDPGHRPVPLDDPPPYLPSFDSRVDALEWCSAERANLVTIVRVAAERGEHVIAWQLACALLSFFYLRKHWDDWILTHRIAM